MTDTAGLESPGYISANKGGDWRDKTLSFTKLRIIYKRVYCKHKIESTSKELLHIISQTKQDVQKNDPRRTSEKQNGSKRTANSIG
jgi:hypothetical protein